MTIDGGFADPITAGTVLIQPAIRSPNFVHGVSGWSVNADGTAEFRSIILPGGIGATVTFGAAFPGSPSTGDLCYRTDLGLEVFQWNGSTWTGYQISAGAISPTAGILGSQLAALAGITSGQISATARQLGGITTTIAASAPGGALAGDLWFDTSNGNRLNQYSGSAWAPFTFGTGSLTALSVTAAQIAANTITAAQIAANTITVSQLAAGIVYATIVDGTTITGAQFVAYGSTGEILVYSGIPAAGNLIGSWSATAGTDGVTNTYPAGFSVASPGGSSVTLNPNVNQAFNVTTLIAGFLQAAEQYITSDVNEIVAGNMGALLLGTGTATKMATAVTSPFGTSGAAMILEAKNDAGTDTAVITFGTVTTPDAGITVTYTPIVAITPYAFLLYSGASGQTTVTKTSGSGTIPVPVGVTTAKGESWGPGGSGYGGAGSGGGGGGGEYSCETALAVPSGGTAAYSVPLSGASATLTGSSVTVTAHVGANANAGTGAPGAGGTGSGNTVHFPGGAGGTYGATGGGGGGGSGGTGHAGNAGAAGGSPVGGAGAAAVTGGGPGGAGGASGSSGHAPVSGPGGGGGGTGASAGGAGLGQGGQVRLTYSTGAPAILFSVATAAGTDQFGTAYPAGVYTTKTIALQDPNSAGTAETWHTVTAGPGFLNSWTDRHGTSATYPPTAYRLAADSGDVMLNIHAVAGTLTNGTAIFTLPTGYVPGSTQIIPVAADMSAAPNATTGTPCLLIRGTGDSNPGQVQAYNLGTVTTRVHNAAGRYSLTGG